VPDATHSDGDEQLMPVKVMYGPAPLGPVMAPVAVPGVPPVTGTAMLTAMPAWSA
jgi:hypothetical protein